MMFIPEILDMLDDMLVDMVLNVSSFNNASTTSILSAMELLNYNDNEIFEHGVAALTTALQSRLSNFLFLIVSLIWTRIQHKNILILTELKERIIYVWTQRNRGRGAQSKSRDGDTAQDEPKTWSDIFLVVLFIGLMHVAMYRVYLEPCQIQPFVLRYTGKLLISSIPLLLPRSFYSGWPTLSKFFIMLWGKLWVSDVNMAMVVIDVFHAFLYMFVMFTPFWSLIKCVMKLEEAKEKLPMAERDQFIRDNFCSHVKSEYLPTLKKNICLCSSWALRTLQDLLSL
ncbi:hypothetical protein HDV62DRAFT_386979 [Trichoderma sp. SZMC 28011]